MLTWATANAPVIDPDWAAQGKSIWLPPLTKPLLMLWPTLKDDPALSDSERETIGNWLQSLISPRRYAGWPSDDLGYFTESVNVADAIRHADDTGFAWGVARFHGALEQMRPDGSFPQAAQLSACSATYSNVDLLHLVSIAEMAAVQGYDLYHMEFAGKTNRRRSAGIGTDDDLLSSRTGTGLNRAWQGMTGGFFPTIVEEFLRPGFTAEEIAKISGGNFGRVFGAVTGEG